MLTYEIDIPAATTLIVNQNYDAGWLVSQERGDVSEVWMPWNYRETLEMTYRGAGRRGARKVRRNGLLAVALPPGHQQLVLSYRGRAFEIGAALSLSALIALILLVVYEPRHGKTRLNPNS